MLKRLEVRKEKLSEFWQISGLISFCVCPTLLLSALWGSALSQLAHWQHDLAGWSHAVCPRILSPLISLLCRRLFFYARPAFVVIALQDHCRYLQRSELFLQPRSRCCHWLLFITSSQLFVSAALAVWPVFKINTPDHNNGGFLTTTMPLFSWPLSNSSGLWFLHTVGL